MLKDPAVEKDTTAKIQSAVRKRSYSLRKTFYSYQRSIALSVAFLLLDRARGR